MIRVKINSFLIAITFLFLSGCKKSGGQSSSSLHDTIGGGSINTAVDTVAVPEPGTLLLLVAGLGGLALWKSRKK